MVWLSVWSEVQIVCIWSSRCHCHHKIPPSHASFKSKLVFTFLVRLAQVVLEKMPLNGCSSSSSSSKLKWASLNLTSTYLCMVLCRNPTADES